MVLMINIVNCQDVNGDDNSNSNSNENDNSTD